MQRVGVQCYGSRFPSSVPGVCPSAFVDNGSIMKHTALRSLMQSMQQNNVCDTTSPGCYSHLSVVIPHFTMESVERIQRSLPRDAWVTSIDLVDTYFHIPTHRGYRKCLRFQTWDIIYQFQILPFGLSPAPWVFIKIMTDQNAGTRVGHQSLSVPGLLAHLFSISRPVHPRHCKSAQSLPHDGPPHSRQEVGTDLKTEIPFFWDTSSTWFSSKSLQLWIDITNQALICSFLLSQEGGAHTWQILHGLFASTEQKLFLWDGCTPAKPDIASRNIVISMF